MNKLIPFALLIFTVIACSGSPPRQPEVGVFADNKRGEIQAKILTKVGTFPKSWDRIEFKEWRKDNITIDLNYRTMPSGYMEVELDTKRVTKAVLGVLLANGYNPQVEWLSLYVYGQRHELGDTGSSVVRWIGTTRYDFNSDSLEFEQKTR